MTKHDRRKVTPEYEAWVTAVKAAYLEHIGLTRFDRIAISFVFRVPGWVRLDLKNLIAGTEDALKGIAFDDDDIDHIPVYDRMEAVRICATCEDCPTYSRGQKKGTRKPHCGNVASCPRGGATLTFRPLDCGTCMG